MAECTAIPNSVLVSPRKTVTKGSSDAARSPAADPERISALNSTLRVYKITSFPLWLYRNNNPYCLIYESHNESYPFQQVLA